MGVSSSGEEHEFFKAAPEGDPAGFPVAFATEVAAQSRDGAEEFSEGHLGVHWFLPHDLHQLDPLGRGHFDGRAIGRFAGGRFQLQQARGQRGQD